MIKNRENEKGIVMYISLIVSGSLLVAAAVISSILIGEYKVSGDIQKSMEAVDASGSGLESILYQSRVNKNAFWSGGSVTSFTGDCKNFTGNMSVNTASINTDCSILIHVQKYHPPEQAEDITESLRYYFKIDDRQS